eukprot:11632077-Ditylum_brightwellii.AAC.1
MTQSKIEEILELYKIKKTLHNFIIKPIPLWRTGLHLHHANGTGSTKKLFVKSEIFQGYLLSSIIFCIVLFPLSWKLYRANTSFRLAKIKVSHFNDIGLHFGLDKCVVVPVMPYKFGILKQNKGELANVDRKARKILTQNGSIIQRQLTTGYTYITPMEDKGLAGIIDTYAQEYTALTQYIVISDNSITKLICKTPLSIQQHILKFASTPNAQDNQQTNDWHH